MHFAIPIEFAWIEGIVQVPVSRIRLLWNWALMFLRRLVVTFAGCPILPPSSRRTLKLQQRTLGLSLIHI
eukprot:3311476-Amphidinium_carterae.2